MPDLVMAGVPYPNPNDRLSAQWSQLMREGQPRGPRQLGSQSTDTPVATIIDSLARADGVVGSLLIGADGLTTSSAGFKNGAAATVAEQAIDIVRVCHSLALRLGAGACINTMIEGHQGCMMAVMIDDRVLVALARPGVAIAPAVLALREAARRLRELAEG